MAPPKEESQASFAFVAYDGPRLPRDPTVRTLIRRRAMKDVAATRKRTGNYGQHNLRQLPPFLESDSAIEDDSTSPAQERERPASGRVAASPGGRLSSPPTLRPALSSLSVEQDLSLLLDLAPLTGLRLGIAAQPGQVVGGLKFRFATPPPRLGGRKLLSFIPSRYGQVSSLSCAADCVVAKLRQMIQRPADGETAALLCYTRAIRALQAALADDAQRTTPETLCATELLSVFEFLQLLDGGSPEAHSWIRHAGGAARLIQIRGADRFDSEFEMALLMAHVGPTVMDAFLSNKSCFLAEKPWKQVMDAAIRSDESFPDESIDLVLALWGHLVNGPQIFKETTDIICSHAPPRQDVIDGLTERLLSDRRSLQGWLVAARTRIAVLRGPSSHVQGGDEDFFFPTLENESSSSKATELALLGTYATSRILKSRLLFALAPSRFRHLEIESQHLAARMLAAGERQGHGGESLVTSLLTSQSTWIAKGVVETRDTWGGRLRE